MSERIKLGDLVRDTTGFTGYVTARTDFMHDQTPIFRVSRCEGTYLCEYWIAGPRLTLEKAAVPLPAPVALAHSASLPVISTPKEKPDDVLAEKPALQNGPNQ